MKITRFLLSFTSILMINSFTLPVKAMPDCKGMTPRPYVEPSTLANMAFRGAFKEQGIPASTQLGNEIGSRSIKGEDIVKAAIDACYLSNDYGMRTNDNFARDVEKQLRAIYK